MTNNGYTDSYISQSNFFTTVMHISQFFGIIVQLSPQDFRRIPYIYNFAILCDIRGDKTDDNI